MYSHNYSTEILISIQLQESFPKITRKYLNTHSRSIINSKKIFQECTLYSMNCFDWCSNYPPPPDSQNCNQWFWTYHFQRYFWRHSWFLIIAATIFTNTRISYIMSISYVRSLSMWIVRILTILRKYYTNTTQILEIWVLFNVHNGMVMNDHKWW